MRDGQLAAAQAEAAELHAALADSEARRTQLEAALSEAQAEAGYARLEAEEARRDAATQLAAMRSELWAAEARTNLAAYGTPEGEGLGAGCWLVGAAFAALGRHVAEAAQPRYAAGMKGLRADLWLHHVCCHVLPCASAR